MSTRTEIPRSPPGGLALRAVTRAELADWHEDLSLWLLPGAPYPVQHTWPQLYRRDGHGESVGLFDGAELASHAAMRRVELVAGDRTLHAGLIGSVATHPARRGEGLASRLLRALTERGRRAKLDVLLLWAERPELYARTGFVTGPREAAIAVAADPSPETGVRRAELADQRALHALHEAKPRRVRRSLREMSLLLSTPGMDTLVLERDGAVVAYACCGKGSDFRGWWHETGGEDADLARLLPSAMTMLGQEAAPVLLPPYRQGLVRALEAAVVDRQDLDGPMLLPLSEDLPRDFYVDGLDSI